MARHTIQVPIDKSAFVDAHNPNTNYGNLAYLRSGYYDASIPSDWRNRYVTFVSWDKSLIPVRKNIISATLKLYSRKVAGSNDMRLGIADTQTPWQENTITYNNPGKYAQGLNPTNNPIAQTNQWFSKEVPLHILGEQYVGAQLEVFYIMTNQDYYEFNSTRESSNKPYLEVVYDDVPPGEPNLLEPIGLYKDNSSLIRFEWQYVSSVGGEQKGFDFQWSSDSGQTWNIITQATANNYYDMPPDIFPSGNIAWRVRTYNEYDEVSEYSQIALFYAVGAPPTPVIQSITNSSRPIVSWSASEQQIYQVHIEKEKDEIIVYDSGNVPSLTKRSNRSKVFLEDGEYIAKVRIKNEYDIWSVWGESFFVISTVKPEALSFILQNTPIGIDLLINGIDTVDYCLIYRSELNKNDFKCISITTESHYQDNTVKNNSEYQYYLRAVLDDAFNDSEIKIKKAMFKYSLLAPISNLVNPLLLKVNLDKAPERSLKLEHIGNRVFYTGRKYPVHEISEFEEKSYSFTYLLRNNEELERFIDIYDLKETVLFRDQKGKKIYGTVSNVSIEDNKHGYILYFAVDANDYNEEVEV